jgi:hypothetical protein
LPSTLHDIHIVRALFVPEARSVHLRTIGNCCSKAFPEVPGIFVQSLNRALNQSI